MKIIVEGIIWFAKWYLWYDIIKYKNWFLIRFLSKIKCKIRTRSGVDNVLDGRLLDVGHVPKDGEDEDTGQQARAGVDETRYDGISEI